MSFARAKLSRCNEKDNPSASLNGSPSSHSRSYIPKIRSASQPSTAPSSKDNLRSRSCSDQMKIGHVTRPESIKSEHSTIRDRSTSQSVKSEEFKDALDDKMSDLYLDDAPDVYGCKKNSYSAIPVPVKSLPKQTPPKPNYNPKMQLRSSSGYSSKISPAPSPERRGLVSANKRSMELQFNAKKKRLDGMKKEFLEKQKPVIELYQSLVVMKKKLEEGGKIVVLDTLKVIDCGDSPVFKGIIKDESMDFSAGGERLIRKVEFQLDQFDELKKVVKSVPVILLKICKQLMEKRGDILKSFEEKVGTDAEGIPLMETYKRESGELEELLGSTFAEQQKKIEEVLEHWQKLCKDSEELKKDNKEKENKEKENNEEIVRKLEEKIKKQEKVIQILKEEKLMEDKASVGSNKEGNNAVKLDEEGKHLKEHVKVLEKRLEHDKVERRKLQDDCHKLRELEQTLRVTRTRYKDLETDKQKTDCKVVHLSSELRKSQALLKQIEARHDKTTAEMEKQMKLDAGVVEKLNKSKNVMETRLDYLQDQMDLQRADFQRKETTLLQELADVRAENDLNYKSRQCLQNRFETLQRAKSMLEMQTQQAVDIIKNKESKSKTGQVQEEGDGLVTDMERHLYTEKVVLETVLKATQEKVESYTNEKLRFIQTMEIMNSSSVEELTKELLKRDEELIQLEAEKKKHVEMIEDLKLDLERSNIELESLRLRIENEFTNVPKEEEDMRRVLIDGKMKLEQAMKKTMENEQRILKYEADSAKQGATMVELENLLKVRDGLIGMMKQKKDELSSDNDSLTKYANGVRSAMFEAQESLSEKTVQIHKLRDELKERSKNCARLEARVHELETILSVTNEKRFKLQDTIGTIEKELQSTKAHLAADQTRARNKFYRPW